jgi:pimeloyl-ACP methyl ester carboxylesterase
MPYVHAGDQRVYFIEKGDFTGEPVVLIHGNWSSSTFWEPVLDRLPHGYRGIAYDMRGRGRTESDDHGYTMPEMAADLRAFLGALDLDSVHLGGHSLGSAVAMQFTLEEPARVRTITALAPAWVDGMPEAFNVPAGQLAVKADRELFARSLRLMAPTAPDDEHWQRVVAEGFEQRIEAALRNLPALVAWKPGDALRKTGVPALVINGDLDPLTGGASAERTAQALGARHVVIAGVGHSPNTEAPDEFVRLLIEHITASREEK